MTAADGSVFGPCDHPALRPDRETIGLFVCCQCWHKFTLAEARPAEPRRLLPHPRSNGG
jgi:hypothetical protein